MSFGRLTVGLGLLGAVGGGIYGGLAWSPCRPATFFGEPIRGCVSRGDYIFDGGLIGLGLGLVLVLFLWLLWWMSKSDSGGFG